MAICVDTSPLLERSFAHEAGLGWIGRNTCLINQNHGSGFSSASFSPRSNSHRIRRRPTAVEPARDASMPAQRPPSFPPPTAQFELDARLCIAYFTSSCVPRFPKRMRPLLGHHVFGCDICQDVCPWNRRAATTSESGFLPREVAPPLERMATLTESEFRALFRDTPVSRAKYSGFLRNVAIAMGNARLKSSARRWKNSPLCPTRWWPNTRRGDYGCSPSAVRPKRATTGDPPPLPKRQIEKTVAVEVGGRDHPGASSRRPAAGVKENAIGVRNLDQRRFTRPCQNQCPGVAGSRQCDAPQPALEVGNGPMRRSVSSRNVPSPLLMRT